jgi:DNA-binding transcriptional MerR regulator
MEPDEDTTWSVGRLAGASGLTVRTLHHWDAIGLLTPSLRTSAGHRRYDAGDVRRLYRILALRRLGLPLSEIGAVLEREGPDLRGAVERHLRRVEEQLTQVEQLRGRLTRLLEALDAGGTPSGGELIDTIEVMTMHEQYYDADQLQQLAERRDALGPEGMERVQREWADLIDEVRAHKDAGVEPGDPRMQACAARWQVLLEQFTGGDSATRQSLQRVYETEGAEQASHGMMDPEADVLRRTGAGHPHSRLSTRTLSSSTEVA